MKKQSWITWVVIAGALSIVGFFQNCSGDLHTKATSRVTTPGANDLSPNKDVNTTTSTVDDKASK